VSDWNDKTVPLGKRKQDFVRWALTKGMDIRQAKLACYRYFRKEIEAQDEREYWKAVSEADERGIR